MPNIAPEDAAVGTTPGVVAGQRPGHVPAQHVPHATTVEESQGGPDKATWNDVPAGSRPDIHVLCWFSTIDKTVHLGEWDGQLFAERYTSREFHPVVVQAWMPLLVTAPAPAAVKVVDVPLDEALDAPPKRTKKK